MKHIVFIFLFLTCAFSTTAQPDLMTAKTVRATQRLVLRSDSLEFVRRVIAVTNTHKDIPTAKAVYDYLQSAGYLTAVTTNATLSGAGTSGSPLGIAQQGATSGQVLKWNGTSWAPAADNAGSTSQPANQIVYGTGASVSSTSVFNYDAVLGRLGLGNTSPLAPIHVGNQNSNPSSETQILVSRILTNTGIQGHAYSDGTLVDNGKSYNSYDARVTINQNTNAAGDHYAAFQSVPTISAGKTLGIHYALYDGPTNNGTITDHYLARGKTFGSGTSTNYWGVDMAGVTGGTIRGLSFSGTGTTAAHGVYLDNITGPDPVGLYVGTLTASSGASRSIYLNGAAPMEIRNLAGSSRDMLHFARGGVGGGEREGITFACGYPTSNPFYYVRLGAIITGALKGDFVIETNNTGSAGIGQLTEKFRFRSDGVFQNGRLASDPTNLQGGIYYNTTTNKLRYSDGTTWADIIAGGGGGATNLAYTGTSSPVTLTSDTGTDVTLTAGSGMSLSATSSNLTITNSGDTNASDDITGSGAADRVPFFTGTQTVSSSANFQWKNASNRLEIYQAGGNTTEEALRLEKSGGWTATSFYNYASASPASRGLRIGASPAFQGIGDVAELMTLDVRNARVAIKKTFPSYSLHVGGLNDTDGVYMERDTAGVLVQPNAQGDVVIRTNTGFLSVGKLSQSISAYNPDAPVHIYTNSGAGSNIVYKAERTGGFGYSYWSQFYNSFSSYGFSLGGFDGTGNRDMLTVDSKLQRVGINNTSPAYELDATGTINASVALNAPVVGTVGAVGFSIRSNNTTRTTYGSSGTVTHTLPANQSHVFDQSASAAVSNSPVVAKGPVNTTQSTIFYSGQDGSGNPQYAVAADNTSVQVGATANKPLYFVSNGTYRGRIEAAAGQWVFGGSAASTAATNAAATFYTTNTASAPAAVLRPYEVGDVAEYARFETPGGTLRGKLEYNSGLLLTASGGATAAMQGATSSLLTNSGANKLTLASTGQVEYTTLTSDPSGLLPGHLWYNSTDARFKMREASATNVVATVEKDIAGTSTTVTSATHTPGASVLCITYDATSNAITATLGANMLEGRTYLVRGTGNATNNVTLSADTGYTLTVDGTTGTVTSQNLTTHEIVRVTRYSTTFFIDK